MKCNDLVMLLAAIVTTSAVAAPKAAKKESDNYWELRLAQKFAHDDGAEEFWVTKAVGDHVDVYRLCDPKKKLATAKANADGSWSLSAKEGNLTATTTASGTITIKLKSETYASGQRIAATTCSSHHFPDKIVYVKPKTGERSFAQITGDALHLEAATKPLPIDPWSTINLKTGSAYPMRLEGTLLNQTSTTRDNGDTYNCQSYSTTAFAIRGLESVPTLGPNAAIWPGALLQGRPYSSGKFAPISIRRGPGSISVSGVNLDASAKISIDLPTMSGEAVNAAITELLAQRAVSTEANVSFRTDTIYNADQLAYSLGTDGRFLNGLDGIIHVDANSKKSYTLATFRQTYYTASFEDPEDKYAVFKDGENLSDPENQMGSGNPPLYVKTVEYGRVIYFLVTSTYDSTVIQNILNSANKNQPGNTVVVNGTALSYDQILQNSTVSYFVQGGEAIATLGNMGLISNVSKMYDAIKKTITDARIAQVTERSKGLPIAYSLAYLTSRQPASLGFLASTNRSQCQTVPKQYYSYQVDLTCIDDEAEVSLIGPNGVTQQIYDGKREGTSLNLDLFIPQNQIDQTYVLKLRLYNIAGPSCLNFRLTRAHPNGSRVTLNGASRSLAAGDNIVHTGGEWWCFWIVDYRIRINRKTGEATVIQEK